MRKNPRKKIFECVYFFYCMIICVCFRFHLLHLHPGDARRTPRAQAEPGGGAPISNFFTKKGEQGLKIPPRCDRVEVSTKKR